MTLADLTSALRRFWLLATAAFIIVVVVGAAAALLPEERYASTVTLFAQPQSGQGFDFGATQAVEFVVPVVVTQVGLSAFQESVRSDLDPAEADAFVEVTASNEPGTGVVQVEAVATTPAAAEVAADRAGELLTEDRNLTSAGVQARVLNPATPATSISRSRRVVIIVGSIVLGAIAALFAALAAAQLRPRTPSARVISERYGAQVIGEIPYVRGMNGDNTLMANGFGAHAVNDALQRLAVNIEILTESPATIAVTSWGQGEGKTTVTAGLAWALASLGHRCVAVDCDLRKPSLHARLGVDPEGGMDEIAAGRDPRELFQHTGLDTLDVITAGRRPTTGNPAELVFSALPVVRDAFEDRIILIDTPPLFAAEASRIATNSDYVLLVVDAKRTEPEEMRDAIRELSMAQANVLGIVLNRARTGGRSRRTGYYYRSPHPGQVKT